MHSTKFGESRIYKKELLEEKYDLMNSYHPGSYLSIRVLRKDF
jgi:hypothetical protein